MSEPAKYTIGQLAAEFDITTRTIRFYEQEGLLQPARRGQTRLYGEQERVRLMLILRGKRLAFSLTEIREVFDLYDSAPGGSRKQLLRMLDILAEKRAGLNQQLKDIQRMQVELKEMETRCREELANLPAKTKPVKAE